MTQSTCSPLLLSYAPLFHYRRSQQFTLYFYLYIYFSSSLFLFANASTVSAVLLFPEIDLVRPFCFIHKPALHHLQIVIIIIFFFVDIKTYRFVSGKDSMGGP